eukprot:6697002-Ditylum_brightwellii.AAC.1
MTTNMVDEMGTRFWILYSARPSHLKPYIFNMPTLGAQTVMPRHITTALFPWYLYWPTSKQAFLINAVCFLPQYYTVSNMYSQQPLDKHHSSTGTITSQQYLELVKAQLTYQLGSYS